MPGVLNKSETLEPGIGNDAAEMVPAQQQPALENGAVDIVSTQQQEPEIDPVKLAMEYLYGGNSEGSQNLEQAVDGLRLESVDKEIKQLFEKLRGAVSMRAEDDISPVLIAIERILENLNKMRLYIECQELEIADSLLYCMNAKHVEIKKGVCDIVKQICNLEPDCQEFFTNRRFIFALLSIVDNHKDDDFVSRALDALIAVLTDNLEALDFLQYHAGLSTLLHTIMRENAEWTIKIVTYLEEACNAETQLPLTLISQDYIPELVILLAKPRKRSHGSLLKLLVMLVEQDYDALDELARSKLDVKEILKHLLETSADQPDLNQERADCFWLLRCIRNLEMGRAVDDRD